MSMIMNLLRISKQELENYLRAPSLFKIKPLLTMHTPTHAIEAFEKVRSMKKAKLRCEQIFDEDMDVGYGPAHYLTPEQVAGIHRKIASLTEADLKAHYDPEAMSEEEELYPSLDWDEEDFDYLYFHFQALQSFFATAANKGDAIVTYLN